MKRKYSTPKPSKRKLSKSTKVYIFCGIGASILILLMFLVYALVAKINLLEWFTSKYAYFVYLGLGIFACVGIILIVKDKIARM